MRLYVLAVGPLFVIAVWLRAPQGARLKEAALLSAGFVVVLLPVLRLLFCDVQAFLFNNLGYHLNRSGRTAASLWHSKRIVAEIIFGLRPNLKLHGIQYPLLFYGAFLHAVYCLASGRRQILAFALALVIMAVSFLPTPTYIQYFSLALPFLLVSAAGLVHAIQPFFGKNSFRRLLGLLSCVLLTLFYLAPV